MRSIWKFLGLPYVVVKVVCEVYASVMHEIADSSQSRPCVAQVAHDAADPMGASSYEDPNATTVA